MGACVPGNQVRACAHPGRPHSHGTRAAYLADRCRCGACRGANTAAERARRRAQLYGRPGLTVEAGPVRDHVHELEHSGIGTAQIAALAGISRATLSRLLWGVPSRGIPPTARLRRNTAHRLLTITAEEDNGAARSLVAAAGTRRRVDALIALGWTVSALARELGRDPANLRATLRRNAVTRDTARAVSTLYDNLTHQAPNVWYPAPAPYGVVPCSSVGPPSADEDEVGSDHGGDKNAPAEDEFDDFDIEIAVDRVTAGRAIRLNDAERDELVRRLTNRGHSLQQIAGYLQVSPRTISRRRRALRAA